VWRIVRTVTRRARRRAALPSYTPPCSSLPPPSASVTAPCNGSSLFCPVLSSFYEQPVQLRERTAHVPSNKWQTNYRKLVLLIAVENSTIHSFYHPISCDMVQGAKAFATTYVVPGRPCVASWGGSSSSRPSRATCCSTMAPSAQSHQGRRTSFDACARISGAT
jgi:hypothetical protein